MNKSVILCYLKYVFFIRFNDKRGVQLRRSIVFPTSFLYHSRIMPSHEMHSTNVVLVAKGLALIKGKLSTHAQYN